MDSIRIDNVITAERFKAYFMNTQKSKELLKQIKTKTIEDVLENEIII